MATGINPHIFRANDIRGKVGSDLNPEAVQLLGKGFGTYIQKHSGKTVIIGRDNRMSSKGYQDNFVEGLISTGCVVHDIGLVTTPMLYFGLRHFKLDSAVVVTGSHNPPDMNGFKLCNAEGAIAGKEIQVIREIIEAGVFAQGAGAVAPHQIQEPYELFMKQHFTFKKQYKIVVDGGNSIGGHANFPILSALNMKVLPLYCDLDGTFPNHFPDPTVVAHNKDLIHWVKEKNYDFGVGFDGDGDRLGIVDNKGVIRWGDQMMILFSREILKKNPGAKILCEVKCSHALIEDVEKNGGIPVMCPTGHSIVEEKLKEEKALLAGEMSGHIFFNDRYFGYDDALYATLRLVELLDIHPGKTLHDLFSDIPQYFASPEIRVSCADETKFGVVDQMKASFQRDGYEMITIDGARVQFGDGWGLIRASQTEGKLIMRFEGKTQEKLEEIKNVFAKKLEEVGMQLPE
ncbi:MAG: phosphomannomutase/phosphoglucomutase [bacterium]